MGAPAITSALQSKELSGFAGRSKTENSPAKQKKVDVCRRWVNFTPEEPMMPDAATVTVHVPGPLRAYSAGAGELALSVTNLRAVLEELERHYPALHRSVCDDTGAVRRHINLFVNTHHMRDRNGLDTPLVPGDEVSILPAVSGG